MSKKRKKSDDASPGVPVYIVTFSDMVTLLLTFFVMLLSMADDKNPDLFEVGQTSFKRALADFGITGFVLGKTTGPEFEHPKVKYNIEQGHDQPNDRAIDAETEMLRRIVMDLEKKMKVQPSRTDRGTKNFIVTDIRFAQGGYSLSREAKGFLNQLSQNLQAAHSGDILTVYVVGLGNSETSEKQKWLISARRAKSVVDYIESTLPDNLHWTIYAWGAGRGGDWTGKTGTISKETEILITTIAN